MKEEYINETSAQIQPSRSGITKGESLKLVADEGRTILQNHRAKGCVSIRHTCYNCGIGGHKAATCRNTPNRESYRQRRKKARRRAWNERNMLRNIEFEKQRSMAALPRQAEARYRGNDSSVLIVEQNMAKYSQENREK